MDNNDISKIPVSELTPENINSLKDSTPERVKRKIARSSPSSRKKSKASQLPIIITGIILAIGVCVALFFIFRQPASIDPNTADESELPIGPSPEDEIVRQNYISDLESTIDNTAATTEERLSAGLSLANFYINNSDYEKAIGILDTIDRSELNHHQLYNIYNSYSYLYKQSKDSANEQEYRNLASEELNKFWEDNIESERPTTKE